MSIFNNLYNLLFKNPSAFSASTTSISNSANISRTSSNRKNLTFPDTVNVKLTEGLWHNAVEGYKLGGQLCYNPIKIPLSFMGVPFFDFEDHDVLDDKDFWLEKIKYYNDSYIQGRQNIELLCHRDGTVIIWPWYDSSSGYVKWRWIRPNEVYRVIWDMNTQEPISIITSIDYEYYDNETYSQKQFTEVTIYSKQTVIIRRTGSIPSNKKNEEIRRNPLKILPIVFANQKEPGELEGHSDYERIIPHIRAYSEINKAGHENLINLGPKLIQYANDIAAWKSNNSFAADLNNVSISSVDFVLNKTDAEKTEILMPTDIVKGYADMMEIDFINIVESSGIPEIAWGLKTQGNHASAREQIGVLLSFVADKQTQEEQPFLSLYNATLQLEAISNMKRVPENLILNWNDLDSMDEIERSTIFKNWSDGVSILLENKCLDLESAHKMLYDLSKGKITSDFDEFKKGIIDYGTIKAYLEQDYITIRENTLSNNQQ